MIGFRPVTQADAGRLRDWIGRPHWQDWWGDPVEETARIVADLDDPGFAAFILTEDGRDAGYIQSWTPDGAWDIPVPAPPETTRGVDLSVADAADLGRGLGRRALAAFCDRLAAEGIGTALIDPHPDNIRARRAYARAGFTEVATGTRADGPYVLMRRDLTAKDIP